MPAAMTHSYFGWDVCKKMNKKYDNNKFMIFILGAEGPDFLYYDILSRSSQGLGKIAHREKVFECFEAMVDYCTRTKDELALIYCLGYVCHYVLDSMTHPYINYFVKNSLNEGDDESIIHRIFESELDCALLFKKTGNYAVAFEIHNFIPYLSAEQDPIAKVWVEIAKKVYGHSLSKKKATAAMDWFKFILEQTSNKKGNRAEQLQKLEKLFCKGEKKCSSLVVPVEEKVFDTLNSRKNIWLDSSQQSCERLDGFEDLYDAAVGRAIELIGKFQAAVNGEGSITREDFGRNFITGEIIK